MVSCGRVLIGMPTMASANSGRAPIAYRSDNALVAAMRPKSNGSSTMGMKKSVVATIACRSSRRHRGVVAGLAANQQFGRCGKCWNAAQRSLSTPGAILQPQPPPCARESVVAGHRPLMGRVTARAWPCRHLLRKHEWRKAAGVEPTRERSTPPTGFEAQPHARMRMPSESTAVPVGSVAGCVPQVAARPMLVTDASSVANAIEELQDLDAAFAAQADGIAEGRRIHRAAGLTAARPSASSAMRAGA